MAPSLRVFSPTGSCRQREAGAGGGSEELRPLHLAETVPGVATGAGTFAAAVRAGGAGRGTPGYLCKEDIEKVEAKGVECFVATGRSKHGEESEAAPRGRPPKSLSFKERMKRKLLTKRGRAAYARRKVTAEPVGAPHLASQWKQAPIGACYAPPYSWPILRQAP